MARIEMHTIRGKNATSRYQQTWDNIKAGIRDYILGILMHHAHNEEIM